MVIVYIRMITSRRRKKVVRKLDFENCQSSTMKFQRKCIKKMKPKIINEYEEEVEKEELQINAWHLLSSSNIQTEDSTSPVLFRKYSEQKEKPTTSSPVLFKRHMKRSSCNRKKKKSNDSPSTSSQNLMPSPIFKLKQLAKKRKKIGENMNSTEDVLSKSEGKFSITPNSPIILKMDTKKISENLETELYPPLLSSHLEKQPELRTFDIEEDDNDKNEEYDIEEFSQDLSTEKEDITPNSPILVSSESRILSDIVISQDQSEDTSQGEPSLNISPAMHDLSGIGQELDSGKKRKRMKKGGLLARLIDVRKRKASEKRIHEHKRRIMKAEENWRKLVYVEKVWKGGDRKTVKCLQLEMLDDGSLIVDISAPENLYMILNEDGKNTFPNINNAAVLRIAAPWQEVDSRPIRGKILLSPTSVELFNYEKDILLPKIYQRQLDISQYKENEDALFDTLLGFENRIFLC